MRASIAVFISLFTTLLAIINPLEAIPIYLSLLGGKDVDEQRRVAKMSCLYALALMFFFLLFGTLLLRLFGVPLSMVRVVGGIILTRIGFSLFNPSPGGMISAGGSDGGGADIAFIPLAMPIMFGPGVIATIISISASMKLSEASVEHFIACSLAILAAMGVTYLSLIYAGRILKKVGPKGIDAATRITGFFVSAMGAGLVFDGIVEFLQSYGIMTEKVVGG